MYWKASCPHQPDSTAWLNRIAHFAVGILLLHHYRSDLARLSDFYSLVFGIYKSERWAKQIKNEGLVVHVRNLHTFESFGLENIWSKSI